MLDPFRIACDGNFRHAPIILAGFLDLDSIQMLVKSLDIIQPVFPIESEPRRKILFGWSSTYHKYLTGLPIECAIQCLLSHMRCARFYRFGTVSEIECLPEPLAGSSLPIEKYSSRQSVNDVA